jgi:hypothetical protein
MHVTPHVQHGDLVPAPGGAIRMGSDRHSPEESPIHRVTIDRTPFTDRIVFNIMTGIGRSETLVSTQTMERTIPLALPWDATPGARINHQDCQVPSPSPATFTNCCFRSTPKLTEGAQKKFMETRSTGRKLKPGAEPFAR